MKINTSSTVRWAMVLSCAAGTFLLTPASYARRPHAKVELRESREEKGKKDASKDKGTENDNSPDKGDNSTDKGDH